MVHLVDFQQLHTDVQRVLLDLIATDARRHRTLSNNGQEKDKLLLAPMTKLDATRRGAFCMTRSGQDVRLTTGPGEMGGGWDSYVVDDFVYNSMHRTESICWVKCPPFTNTTLTLESVQQNPSGLFHTCLCHGGLKQITSMDTNKQLEWLVSNGVDGEEYQDEHGTTRHLYTLGRHDNSILDAFQIGAYVSVHPRDDSRIRVLLRGTVVNMNRMARVRQFLASRCPSLYTSGIAFTAIEQHLSPFVESNAVVLGIDTKAFDTVVLGYLDVVRVLFRYGVTPNGGRNDVTICHLPSGIWSV